ncbi:MAG: hypothetical protein ACR2HJ_11735 [Fimbriimonadales bacterium]
MKLLNSLGLLLIGITSPAQFAKDTLVGRDEVFIMRPPEYVAGPTVRHANWSPDGRYLLLSGYDTTLPRNKLDAAAKRGRGAPSEESIWLWSTKTHKTERLWSGVGGASAAVWLHKSDTALIVATEESQGVQTDVLMRITASTGKIVYVTRQAQNSVSVQASPKEPIAYIDLRDQDFLKGSTLHRVGPEGPFGPPIKLPPELRTVGMMWAEGGVPVVVGAVKPEGGRWQKHYFALDPNTGKMTALQERPNVPLPPVPVSPLIIAEDRQTLPKGTARAEVRPAWLTIKDAPNEAALVAADLSEVYADACQVAPSSETVFYISGGMCFIRPIIRMSRAEYDKGMESAKRTESMAKANQVAKALLMYAGDNDDMLPGKGADLESIIGPYLPEANFLDGFTYTFAGGSLAGLNLATTELGFMSGPGGRAVTHADGHTVWIPN